MTGGSIYERSSCCDSEGGDGCGALRFCFVLAMLG